MKISVSKRIQTVLKSVSKRAIVVKSPQDGSAMVIALLVLAMVLAFVALAVSRTSNETIASSNDAAESRAFSASQASLEVMTRNFDKIFEEKLSPAPSDLQHVIDLTPPGFDTDYTFKQNLTQTKATQTVVMTGQLLQGLNALRDEWQLDTTATDKSSGVQVALRRQFYNNRIPIFQFGIFYDDDLEIHPGARFDFGGRVHSNANLFMMTSAGLYFSSRVSAVGQVFTDVARNGLAYTKWGEKTYIKNASGTYVQLLHDMGSVLSAPVNGSPAFTSSDMPTVYKSSNWATNKGLFQGNLLTDQPRLDLPLVIASKINGTGLDYVELIKRGKTVGDLYNNGTTVTAVTAATADTLVTSKERYFNKKGIRISLSDSKAKLPGCATGSGTSAVTTVCGVRLDGDSSGDGTYSGGVRGYQPMAMTDGYQGTRLNGERFFTGNEIWIKIELVSISAVDNTIQTQDVTKDFLSLGITEAAPFASSLNGYVNGTWGTKDSRSIIKLQRFAIPGVAITNTDTNYSTYSTISGTNYNVINSQRKTATTANSLPASWTAIDNGFSSDNAAQSVCEPVPSSISVGTQQNCYMAFPIEMFDSREGLYNVGADGGYLISGDKYNIPLNGVMSMVDIDIANLKKYFNGDFNSLMPTSGTDYTGKYSHAVRNTDVPQANGWVLYISDRRGDYDFDGDYDMENVYTSDPNEATNSASAFQQVAEDINKNGKLDVDYTNEGVRYSSTELPEKAATIDHKYYRRGVRLINGDYLPGKYDSANALNTQGFTVASENGVYVWGNYNADSIASVGTPTVATDYGPQGAQDVPASIAADAITILSNSWTDASSFRYPFDITGNKRKASETFLRFAMLSGDTISSYDGTPNQGTGEGRLSGGVHNFKRFLEDWGSVRVNYAGSLINLYNSRNNNGSYKPDNSVYSAPTRNWVFDTSFLDPTRLPPGTPFFQNIQLTGFQRVD